MNPTVMTLPQLLAAFESGSLTAEQVTTACLERVRHLNPTYNALIALNPDALSAARAVDHRRLAGESPGKLAGIPVVVKDTIDVAGLPTTAGWAPLSATAGGTALIPGHDAPVVARLRAAGAVILGKTNVPAFSYNLTRTKDSWAGATLNAVQPELAPGASSAGTATAVAAGFAPIGLAEETAGSIQNPAGAQGLVSVKPTFGLVPNTGVFPVAGSTRDVVGPHARTVYDAALTLDVLAGPTPDDPKTAAAVGRLPVGGYTRGLRVTALEGKRLGLYGPGWKDLALSPETQTLYGRAQQELGAQGAVLVTDPFAGSGLADLRRRHRSTVGFESLVYDLQGYLDRLGPRAPVATVAELRFLGGADIFGEGGILGSLGSRLAHALEHPRELPDLSAFRGAQTAYLDILNTVMDAQQLDALVFPQRSADLPLLSGSEDISSTTVSEINIAGLPGVTVPAGYHASGAPFCLLFLGRPWSEALLLALAFAYEQSTHHYREAQLVRKDEQDL